ncbi:MAG: rod shape-determining protein MreD [Bacteroidota bacterium]
MNNVFLKNSFRFFLLILLQVLVFDNINFRGYLNPYIYILFILLLPFETPKWFLLVSSFLIGFGIDLFSNTMGMHTAACVFIGYSRPGIISFVSTARDYEPGTTPSVRDLGITWFLKYSIIMVLLHHFAFFYLEVFSFHEFFYTFWRVIISTIFTIIFIVLGQYLFYKKK